MKRTTSVILAVFAVAMLLTSCAIHITKREDAAPGKVTTQSYSVTSFKGIDAQWAVEIAYTVSDSISVRAEGHEKDLKHLVITVDSDSILHIGRTGNSNGDGNTKVINLFSDDFTGEVKICISGPALSYLNADGALDFRCKGVMRSPSLDIEVSGASRIEMDSLETTTFKTTTDGASKISIGRIKAQAVSMETSGAGMINVGLANVRSTLFSVDGAGKVNASFDDCDTATVKVSGAGKVELSGTLHHLDRETDGAADIDGDKLKIW